jgi:hypothetical protein
MAISRRHHYLPVFYLKGFLNDRSKLDLFNIQENRMVSKSLPPKSAFFEMDRNTLFLENETTDFIEQAYSLMDDSCSTAFQELSRLGNLEITTDILIKIRFFISTLFWRIPSLDSTIDSFIDSLNKDELKFRIVDHQGKDAPQEVFDNYLNNANFRRAYRVALPLINHRIIKNSDVANWKFYFADQGFHITGDNPIIINNNDVKHVEDTEFIIPLSSGNLLVHKKGERKEMIVAETICKIHLLILLQSTRYACSVNRGYLEYLSKVKSVYNEEKIKELMAEVFAEI